MVATTDGLVRIFYSLSKETSSEASAALTSAWILLREPSGRIDPRRAGKAFITLLEIARGMSNTIKVAIRKEILESSLTEYPSALIGQAVGALRSGLNDLGLGPMNDLRDSLRDGLHVTPPRTQIDAQARGEFSQRIEKEWDDVCRSLEQVIRSSVEADLEKKRGGSNVGTPLTDGTSGAEESAVDPKFTAVQAQVLVAVFKGLILEGKWPKLKPFIAEYSRLRLDFRAIVDSIGSKFIRVDGEQWNQQSVKLTLSGIDSIRAARFITKAFLELVREGAQRFVDNPSRKVKVTRSDLQRLLGAQPETVLNAVSSIVLDEWHYHSGSGKETGDWYRDCGPSSVRLLQVDSIEQYLALRYEQHPKVPLLGPSHVLLLQGIYRFWRRFGRWPLYLPMIAAFRNRSDVYALLQEIPEEFMLLVQFSSDREADEVRLRLPGVVATGIADGDLDVIVNIVKKFAHHCEDTTGDSPLSAEELANANLAPLVTLRRVGRLLQSDSTCGAFVEEKDGSWIAKVTEDAVYFKDIQSFGEFLLVQEKVSAKQYGEKRKVTEAELRKALLEIFSRLPADGSGHLNRFNTLGRPYQPGALERELGKALAGC